ncbi:hypothetical protein B0H14DRAFT_802996 [Mycena olivaceomarginata]|nr:hypothetical protein B0H14DRAFT_802996 [Mycena olivaceomarginata]
MAIKLVLLAAIALAGATTIGPYAGKLVDDAQMPFDMPVFTATRVYRTTTDVPPYIVDRTTTMVWTQSSSAVIACPTGPGSRSRKLHVDRNSDECMM